jgi:hypothetical protein
VGEGELQAVAVGERECLGETLIEGEGVAVALARGEALGGGEAVGEGEARAALGVPRSWEFEAEGCSGLARAEALEQALARALLLSLGLREGEGEEEGEREAAGEVLGALARFLGYGFSQSIRQF